MDDNNIHLNDLKSETLKKVEISDIAVKDEERGLSRQEAQNSIMEEVNNASNRFVKNFENEMKEKYQKEAATKATTMQNDELAEFMDGNSESAVVETGIYPNPEYKSSIDMDIYTNPAIGNAKIPDHIEEEKVIEDKLLDEEKPSYMNIIAGETTTIDTEKSEELTKQIHRPEINNQLEEVLGDPKLSLNTDDFIGSASDSEKIDDSDFELILKERDVVAEQKALINDIRSKINPISKPVDLSTLTLSKNPTFVNNALQHQDTESHVSDWPLFESKQLLSMESFSGTQLEKIDSRNYPNRTKYNMFLEVYKNIFNHIINIKDKSKFIEWLKVLKFFDLNHLWFLVYKTTFEKANIVPYICENPKCNHRYVKEIKKILDMVKFRTDKDKEEFDNIFNNMPSVTKLEYEVKQKQITDNLIIEFRDPSVWNVIFENAILPEKFREKYATLLNTISFIDTMYTINRDQDGNAISKSEVKFTDYPNDMVKNIMSRIYTYAKILESLTSDEKSIVDGVIIDIHEEHDTVSYMIPQDTCPECGSIIEAKSATGEELVFTRQELVGMTLS